MFHRLTFIILTIVLIYAIEDVSVKSNTDDKICQPVDCKGRIKNCPYGYQKQNGCEICKCYDPCNPPGKAMLCGANKRCFIDKKSDGTFATHCAPLQPQKNNDICTQEKVVGYCRGLFRRFYYNLTTSQCQRFIYGGCGGNENNFKTKDECETICIN